jgi:hypothetical protein
VFVNQEDCRFLLHGWLFVLLCHPEEVRVCSSGKPLNFCRNTRRQIQTIVPKGERQKEREGFENIAEGQVKVKNRGRKGGHFTVVGSGEKEYQFVESFPGFARSSF